MFQPPLESLETTLKYVTTRPEAAAYNVLVCGTFFIMKDVRQILGHPHGNLDECDEDFINREK